jgi:hypothetical protein
MAESESAAVVSGFDVAGTGSARSETDGVCACATGISNPRNNKGATLAECPLTNRIIYNLVNGHIVDAVAQCD